MSQLMVTNTSQPISQPIGQGLGDERGNFAIWGRYGNSCPLGRSGVFVELPREPQREGMSSDEGKTVIL